MPQNRAWKWSTLPDRVGGRFISRSGCLTEYLGFPVTHCVLFQANAQDFLKSAVKNQENYGKYGIHAFFAAFHGNVEVLKDGRWLPTAFLEWEQYNSLLDEFMKETK